MLYSVENNRASPLLFLPPEIRNRIFHYAIGGKTFRQLYRTHGTQRFLGEPSGRPNAFALLRTCRQIYAETAVVPFTSNVFSARYCWNLKRSLRSFRRYQ